MKPAKICFSLLVLGILFFLFLPNPAQAQYFIRGDVNCDGVVDSSDVSFLDSSMNHGGPLPPCWDAADVDDDGILLTVSDLVYLLRHLETGESLPLPFPTCGTDPTIDDVDCSASCCTCTYKVCDYDGDNRWTLIDIIRSVQVVFMGQVRPLPECRADCDGSGVSPTLTDIVYLVNKVFKGGPDPVPVGVCCLP